MTRIAGRDSRGDQIRVTPTSQLWPPVVDPSTLTRQVWDSTTALGIPGMARALDLYGGLIGQCALDRYRGETRQKTRGQLLALPDPLLRSRALFARMHVHDYIVHGNALHLVTARNPDTGWPASTRWFPASMWGIDATFPRNPDYYLNSKKIARREDVVHVQRGAAPGEPWRGVGVVEQHLRTLNRAGLQEAAEEQNLTHGGVPSVAVVAPQRHLTQTEVDDAGEMWESKFQGPGRRPGIFPFGTVITPLSFSPADQEATLARKMTLNDLANCLNLDSYWLGGTSSSHEYKSPGPMFLTLQRVSLEPVMQVIEQTWSLSWFAPGESTLFDRLQLTRDDFASSVVTLIAAVTAKLMTREEARVYLGWSPEPTIGEFEETPALPASGGALQLLPGGKAQDDEQEADV